MGFYLNLAMESKLTAIWGRLSLPSSKSSIVRFVTFKHTMLLEISLKRIHERKRTQKGKMQEDHSLRTGSHQGLSTGFCYSLEDKSRLTLRKPTDCIPPGSSVQGISQARILEWVSISSSREPFGPRDRTCIFCISRQILYHWATWEAPSRIYPWVNHIP